MSGELIVCATDFSPQAEAALGWAAAIARRDGGQVDLIHVGPLPSEDKQLLVFDNTRFEAEQARLATERLRDSARAAAQAYDVSVRPQLLRGLPHEAILAHARQENARMVVLGACGLSAVDRLLLGSVADRVVRSADRPVVLVPRPAHVQVWAPPGVAAPVRPPRVVAGLGGGDDGAIVRFVTDLRGAAPVDVTFVHLYWPAGEYERLGLQGRRDLFAADPDVVRSLEPGLRARIGSLGGKGDVTLDVRPAWGEPASNLLLSVEDREADLLVVGAHERHGLARLVDGSIARRLAKQSTYVPIAVIPADAQPAVRLAAIPTVRSVLAVTDLSPLGNAAVAHAYGLLGGTGGVVELCHVHERKLPTPAYAYDAPSGLSDVERARIAKELRDLVPAEASERGITTHVTVVDGGQPAEAIVQAAERLNVDVIAMASRGRSGLARAVLGSVAQEVVHRARRPVFVVRSGA
jgi:nucleotide-binding universal stress UspA family protein